VRTGRGAPMLQEHGGSVLRTPTLTRKSMETFPVWAWPGESQVGGGFPCAPRDSRPGNSLDFPEPRGVGRRDLPLDLETNFRNTGRAL
jgi:hypothetical protein